MGIYTLRYPTANAQIQTRQTGLSVQAWPFLTIVMWAANKVDVRFGVLFAGSRVACLSV